MVLARISADLAMKLTRIDLDSGFGCVFSPLHPSAKGYSKSAAVGMMPGSARCHN